ncbi:unnamed protein product, partial [Ectocarpus sp. 6 AP-2014]
GPGLVRRSDREQGRRRHERCIGGASDRRGSPGSEEHARGRVEAGGGPQGLRHDASSGAPRDGGDVDPPAAPPDADQTPPTPTAYGAQPMRRAPARQVTF